MVYKQNTESSRGCCSIEDNDLCSPAWKRDSGENFSGRMKVICLHCSLAWYSAALGKLCIFYCQTCKIPGHAYSVRFACDVGQQAYGRCTDAVFQDLWVCVHALPLPSFLSLFRPAWLARLPAEHAATKYTYIKTRHNNRHGALRATRCWEKEQRGDESGVHTEENMQLVNKERDKRLVSGYQTF